MCYIDEKEKTIIEEFSFSTKEDYDTGINKMLNFAVSKIAEFQPELVTIEQVHYQMNTVTLKNLSRLQGVLINYFIRNDILYEVITPSQWYGYHKIKGKDKKKQALALAKKLLNDDSITHDKADAFLMALYAKNNISIKYTK